MDQRTASLGWRVSGHYSLFAWKGTTCAFAEIIHARNEYITGRGDYAQRMAPSTRHGRAQLPTTYRA